jgi:hypothetical protein
MKKCFYFFFVVLLFGTISLNAQNFATKGTIELGGSLGFSSTTSVSNGQSASNSMSTFMIEPYFGYFVSNGFELGFFPSLTTQSYSGNSSTSLGIYLAPAWNFDMRSNLFPFLEGRIGYNSYSSGGSSSGGLAWGLKGGVKVKIGGSSLFNLALSYDQITYNPSGWTGGRNGYNIFAINGGFTVFWGR